MAATYKVLILLTLLLHLWNLHNEQHSSERLDQSQIYSINTTTSPRLIQVRVNLTLNGQPESRIFTFVWLASRHDAFLKIDWPLRQQKLLSLGLLSLINQVDEQTVPLPHEASNLEDYLARIVHLNITASTGSVCYLPPETSQYHCCETGNDGKLKCGLRVEESTLMDTSSYFYQYLLPCGVFAIILCFPAVLLLLPEPAEISPQGERLIKLERYNNAKWLHIFVIKQVFSFFRLSYNNFVKQLYSPIPSAPLCYSQGTVSAIRWKTFKLVLVYFICMAWFVVIIGNVIICYGCSFERVLNLLLLLPIGFCCLNLFLFDDYLMCFLTGTSPRSTLIEEIRHHIFQVNIVFSLSNRFFYSFYSVFVAKLLRGKSGLKFWITIAIVAVTLFPGVAVIYGFLMICGGIMTTPLSVSLCIFAMFFRKDPRTQLVHVILFRMVLIMLVTSMSEFFIYYFLFFLLAGIMIMVISYFFHFVCFCCLVHTFLVITKSLYRNSVYEIFCNWKYRHFLPVSSGTDNTSGTFISCNTESTSHYLMVLEELHDKLCKEAFCCWQWYLFVVRYIFLSLFCMVSLGFLVITFQIVLMNHPFNLFLDQNPITSFLLFTPAFLYMYYCLSICGFYPQRCSRTVSDLFSSLIFDVYQSNVGSAILAELTPLPVILIFFIFSDFYIANVQSTFGFISTIIFVLMNCIVILRFLYIIFGEMRNNSSVFIKEIENVIDCFDKEFPAIETLGGDVSISPTRSAVDSGNEHQEVQTPKIQGKIHKQQSSTEVSTSNTSSCLIDQSGGFVSVQNVSVHVLPDSIQEETEIRATLEDPTMHCQPFLQAGLINNVIFASPVIKLEPHGLAFTTPATVRVKLDKTKHPKDNIVVLHAMDRGGKRHWEDVTEQSIFEENENTVSIRLAHFSFTEVLFVRPWVQVKHILSKLALISFDYRLTVFAKHDILHPPYSYVALVFMSSDVYHLKVYREDKNSAITHLKKEGFEELSVRDSSPNDDLYNEGVVSHNEGIRITLSKLGSDMKFAPGINPVESVTVDSTIWRSTGYVLKFKLECTEDVKAFSGAIEIAGEHGHRLRAGFREKGKKL